MQAVIDVKADEADFDAGMADVRAGRVWPHAACLREAEAASLRRRQVARRLVAGLHPIKVFREQRGMSQGDLARAVGTASTAISQIETGVRHPGRALRKRIAEALGVDPADIDEG